MIGKWNYLPLTLKEQQTEEALAARFPNAPAIARLLVLRGLQTPEEVQSFFHPSLGELHDPFLMRDMAKAVARLNQALGSKEKIMIYGDYDVDGTTAVALVYKYLSNFYSNLEYYIPSRDDEGYGISMQSIDYAASIGVKLIIVLDSGIKAFDEIAYAKSKGIDFIICDHHVPDDELPDAVAILNPKLPDDKYPFKELSGCGVGFKFMQAFAKSNGINGMFELEGLLDLVVVSIVADIVPIIGENRILAYYGLRRLNANPSVGLRSIIKLCGLQRKEITVSDIIFKIGPRINAAGRMQSGVDSVELLITKDKIKAGRISKKIDQYNKERKEIDRHITTEANEIIEAHKEIMDSRKPIVLYNHDWHKGIIGIVAARLSEMYFKPTVVMTYSNGYVTGSSRSVKGFDMYSAIKSTKDLLENFGGHTNAVGLSLKEENVPEFKRRLEEYVEQHITQQQITPKIDVDCEITFDEINSDFLHYLRMFNPFGPENPNPVFVTRNVYDCGTSKLVGKNMEHIKLELVDANAHKIMNGIAFNMGQYYDRIKEHKPFSICYTIEGNKHQKNPYVQLQIKAIQISENA